VPTNPPRKRPRVAQGFTNGGRGSLIASLLGTPQDALNSAAATKAAAKDAAATRSREYARQFKDYQDGNSTYGATLAALEAAVAAETDSELKGILQSYVQDTKNTKITRDVNQKVDDYNNGRIGFGELQQALSSVQTDNERLKSGIEKSMAGARKAENSRLLEKLGTQYSDGTIDINAYLNGVHKLRSDPAQKDPNELAKFDAAISGAKQNERQVNDQRAYANWESGGDPNAALAYFSARIATATDPKDIANLGKFVGNIKAIVSKEQAKGNASVGAPLKAAASDANTQLEDYFKSVVEPGVKAANGDPYMITQLYENLGAMAASFVPYVGAEAGYFHERAQSAVIQGRLVAANEIQKKVQTEYERLKTAFEAGQKDSSLTPRALVARLTSMAAEAAKLERGGEYGQWTTQEQKDQGAALRLEAWRLSNGLADKLLKSKDKAESDAKVAVSGAFTDAARAVKANSTSSLAQALLEAGAMVDANGRQIRSDGKVLVSGKWVDADTNKATVDKNRFAEWIAEHPEENALLVFESSHTRGAGTTNVDTASSEASYDASKKKYVDGIIKPLNDSGQFQKDAGVALNEAAFIKSPQERFNIFGGQGSDNMDATATTARPREVGALPLVDSRDGAMLDPGITGDRPQFPSQDSSEAARERNRAGLKPTPPPDPRQPMDPSATLAANGRGASTMNIGELIRGLFEGVRNAPHPASGDNALVTAAGPSGYGISGVEQPVYTPTNYGEFVPPAPVDVSSPTPAQNPGAPSAWAWQIPEPTGPGGASGLPGEAVNGPQLTQ
jgi:hypothetical protein